jgi:hypothetical protein
LGWVSGCGVLRAIQWFGVGSCLRLGMDGLLLFVRLGFESALRYDYKGTGDGKSNRRSLRDDKQKDRQPQPQLQQQKQWWGLVLWA